MCLEGLFDQSDLLPEVEFEQRIEQSLAIVRQLSTLRFWLSHFGLYFAVKGS